MQQTAPVAAMFVFAILYFGIMTDAGLLDPIVDRHPARRRHAADAASSWASALLALLVHLDGSGAVTFLVTVPAMLPLFERLQMDRRILACVDVAWPPASTSCRGPGPMLRASAALHIPTTDLFRPLIPVQIVGLVFVFARRLACSARERSGGWASSRRSSGRSAAVPTADA